MQFLYFPVILTTKILFFILYIFFSKSKLEYHQINLLNLLTDFPSAKLELVNYLDCYLNTGIFKFGFFNFNLKKSVESGGKNRESLTLLTWKVFQA